MTEQEFEQHAKAAGAQIVALEKALANKSIHTNWLFVLVGVFLLFFGLWIFMNREHSYELAKQNADAAKTISDASEKASRADERAKQAEESARLDAVKAMNAQNAEGLRTIAGLIRAQNESIARVQARDQQANSQIQEVTAPNRDVGQVIGDAQKILSARPIVEKSGLSFPVQDVQLFVATKIDRDRLADKLKETAGQLESEKKNAAVLTESLSRTNAIIDQSNKVIADFQEVIQQKNKTIADQNVTIAKWETAAKKSRWQRVMDIAKSAGFVALGIGIGAALK